MGEVLRQLNRITWGKLAKICNTSNNSEDFAVGVVTEGGRDFTLGSRVTEQGYILVRCFSLEREKGFSYLSLE